MVYSTDTHSLIWYFTNDRKLSPSALKSFEKTTHSGAVIISVVVLAEIMYICKKGNVSLTFDKTLKKIEKYENFIVVPLDVEIVKIANSINYDLEMHDKLIISTALYFDAPLITKDEEIKKSKLIKTIW